MKIYNMHVMDGLKQLPDASVDFVFTSPPYYNLRVYKGADTTWDTWTGQLGNEPSYEMFIEHILEVTKELFRVLKKSGTLFWNMGDSYSGPGNNHDRYIERHTKGTRKGIHRTSQAGIPNKSLMMVPERIAIGMIGQGWILRNKIIWYKRNAMPNSVKNRLSNKYEYIYFFTKSSQYYFDLDAIRKPVEFPGAEKAKQSTLNSKFKIATAQDNDNGEMMNSGIAEEGYQGKYRADKRSNVFNLSSYLYVARQKLYEKAKDLYPNDLKTQQKYVNYMRSHITNEKGANPGDVMDIPTRSHSFSHFAVFPETLVRPFMEAGCPAGGTVLDPFAGSGTVAVVAKTLGRQSISIEISPEYVKIIKKRCAEIL
ncbi:site-specific DNA-methyltransferase [Ferroplasma sp.]|uniref:DNA-methyltransferase n=1 Tax=Ferroplasma sp. TaxID=2591003 RepID=UPI0026273EC0|nr:site-specific DNA-methyltransferase [Ferroplasma sp.]